MTPCYKCEERHFLCHAECEKYKAFQEKNRRADAERKKHQMIRDFEIDAARAARKKYHINAKASIK